MAEARAAVRRAAETSEAALKTADESLAALARQAGAQLATRSRDAADAAQRAHERASAAADKANAAAEHLTSEAAAVFLAAAGVVVYLCLLILRPFFGVVAWSTVLAITCYPFHQWLVRRNGRVALSAATTSALVVLAVLVPLVFIGGVAVNQLLALRDSLRQAFLDPDGISRRVTAAFAPLTQRLGLDPDAIVAWASAHASEWVAGAGQYTMSAAAGVGGAILSFALIAVATFLLLRHGETLVATMPDLLPFERTRSEACSFGSGTSCTPACTGS